MIIEPRVRNGICLTAHPEGCAAEVKKQIDWVKSNKPIEGTKSALIIGSSTGYGLSCRIAAAFGCRASTIGVFFEKEGTEKRPGTPGFYNMRVFDDEAAKSGLFSKNINGDAFSDEIKAECISAIKEGPGKVDLVIYSLASGVRTDPKDGTTYYSALKPIGKSYKSIALDPAARTLVDSEIKPAEEKEIESTRKVMGGEDWQLWMDALIEAGVLADNCITTAFSYIGPERTKAIYRDGTIGEAKKDLEATAIKLNKQISEAVNGRAFVSVNKAVVTRAAAVIPAISLYISILFKVMKEKNIHEGCIEQMYRLFNGLYGGPLSIDEEDRIRMDDLEMRKDVQEAVDSLWNNINKDNIENNCDIDGYNMDFLNMHGFKIKGIDYSAEVNPL